MLKPPKRADARRNYDALLAAATEAFAAKATDVPMFEIARRAGVATATLYRNFPTRRDLILAVFVGEVAALISYGRWLSSSEDPRKALQQWVGRLIEHIASYKGLAAALMAGAREDSAVVDACNAAIGGIVAELLTNAQSAGAIRADVDGADLMSVANALALVAESDGVLRAQRMLQLFVDGAGQRGPGDRN